MKFAPALAVAAALALAGCSGAVPAPSQAPADPAPAVESTPTTPPTHKVGDAVEVKDADGNAARVTIASAAYVPGGATQKGRAPSENGGVLTLEVVWETTAGSMSPSVMHFTTKDAKGGAAALSWDSTFGTGAVPAGKSRAGTIVDDIGAGPWEVAYGAMLGTPVFWTVEAP
jgi:hypothetical protein